MTQRSTQPAPQPEFDFEHSLPPGREYFTLSYLATLWVMSEDTVQRLIDEGDLQVKTDLAPRSSTKAMQRIPRWSVVQFLEDRKNADFWEAHRAKLRSRRKGGKNL